MKELMIYVEAIVKPVSATQGRKLRMRLDLLAHLQAAVEEESSRFPDDERQAIEQAKLRLGEPAELTGQLQQTVPPLERALLTRLPLSPRVHNLEQQMACVPGQRGPMTLGHKTVLSALATLAAIPLLLSLHSVLASSDRQVAHLLLSALGIPQGWIVLLLTSYRFVFTSASPDHRFDWHATIKYGAAILGLQTGLTFFIALAVDSRCATFHEVAMCLASTLIFLLLSTLIARRIGVLRRPYDEWLALNIAQ